MLKIRSQQFEVFKPVADEAFARRVAEYLQQKHPNAAVRLPKGLSVVRRLPEKTLLEMIRGGVGRARKYDMTFESTLTAYVVVMFLAAPNFDAHPLIRRALTDEKVAPDSRIEHLWQRISGQNWETVKKNYDPGAWQLQSAGGITQA